MALVREAVTLSGLEGLGVPRVVAFGALPRRARARFLVRELVEGKSLEDVMESERRRVARAARVRRRSADRAPSRGLFHGDIKPANVIVGDDGKARSSISASRRRGAKAARARRASRRSTPRPSCSSAIR